MKKKKIIIAVLVVTSFLTLCFIWGNSLKPKALSNQQSDSVAGVFNWLIAWVGQLDTVLIRKLAHAAEFMLLSMQVTAILLLMKVRNFWIILFTTLFCAVIDETLQTLNDRSPMVTDVLIDFSGAIVGMLIVYGIFRIICYKRDRLKRL